MWQRQTDTHNKGGQMDEQTDRQTEHRNYIDSPLLLIKNL